MSHYEKRLHEDVEKICARVGTVATEVDQALKNAVRALLTADRALACATILGDKRINREIREIDRMCHAFVVRHLPSARHLRLVSAVLRVDRELERIGDYAATIGRETVQLICEPPVSVTRDVELLADHSRGMLAQAAKAFSRQSADLARGTAAMAESSDRIFKNVFRNLIAAGADESCPLQDLFALLVVVNRLERVADRAKNICEETVFWLTGETKGPKKYRILFVDEKNAGASQIAAAIARKAFPDSGQYESAGWDPASRVDPELVAFMEKKGHDLHDATPRKIEAGRDALADYHVVICLGEDPFEGVPFHTVLLEWDLKSRDRAESSEHYEELYRGLASRVRELMETLQGEGAS